jgi:hypothetical protein
MLDKTFKETCIIDVEIPDSQNLHRTITEKVPKYTDLKEGLISIWQLITAFLISFALSTTAIISNKLHGNLKLLNLRPAMYIVTQKAVILDTCSIVRSVVTEQLIRRAWSVRPLLFW